MGTRGPAPKRSSQRRRRNKEAKPTIVKVAARPVLDPQALVREMTKAQLLELAKARGVRVAGSATKATIAAAVAAKAAGEIPPADEGWHPIGQDWYRSLEESGQAQFYEPSDWQAARLVAEELSRYLHSKKRSAMMFSHIWSAMGELLTTEAQRRRVKIEVERRGDGEGDSDADVTDLDAFRKRLAG